MKRLLGWALVVLAGAALSAGAATPATAANTRAWVTTPLAGEALERELDARFGIWFVGDMLPVWAKVTLAAKTTPEEALGLVRNAVKREKGGFRIADVAGSEGKVFVVWANEARVVNYQYGLDPEKVPLTDQVIGQVMPLRKAAAGPLRRDLAVLTGGRDIDMDARHNCLMLVDSSASIHRFMQIIEKMDGQPGLIQPTALRELTFLAAGEAARVINGRFAPPRPAIGGGGANGGGGPRPETVFAVSDARTNTVVVNGPEALVKQALAMIDELEKVAETANNETPARPASRPRVTTPLWGGELADEMDQRYRIWFVGEELWHLEKVTLPANATAEEALALLRAAAKRENGGYEIVEVPGVPAKWEKVYQVTAAGERVIPFRFGDNADEIPLTEEWVGQVIPVKNEVARKLADDLAPLVSGTLTSDTRHNCLIVRDTSAKVHRLVEIVVQMDHHVGKMPMEYRQLTHLDAADVAKAINARFAPPPEPTTTGPRKLTGGLYADFDPRTNTVIMNGPKELLEQAVDMINQMEKEAATKRAEPKAAASIRARVTTVLAGEALAEELDQRYGIWFVGDKLPAWANLTLPEQTTATEAIALVQEAVKWETDGLAIARVVSEGKVNIVGAAVMMEQVPGSEGKVYQVIANGAKALRYRYGNDAAPVPDEGVVTQIIPVRPGLAKEASLDLRVLIGGGSEEEQRAFRHGCAMVTNTGAGVRRVLENIKRVDPNRPPTVIEYVQVKKAGAAEVAAGLNARFGQTTTMPATRDGRFYADHDPRTNTVVLNGPAEQVKEAVEMINQMETEAEAAKAAGTRP
jgi:type II secretory pathway component GspD/PulD (secretin)